MRRVNWLLAFWLGLFLLSSCNNGYKKQICTVDKRVDVSVFDGSYMLQSQDLTDFRIFKMPYYLERMEKGVYQNEEGGLVYVCEFDKQLYIETKMEKTDAYYLMKFDIFKDFFIMTPFGFDREELDKFGISYQIIEVANDPKVRKYRSLFLNKEENDNEPENVLIVDNNDIESAEKFLHLLHPSSLVIRAIKNPEY